MRRPSGRTDMFLVGHAARLFVQMLPQFVPAFWVTVRLAIGSSCVAAAGGLLVALVALSPHEVWRFVVRWYVDIMRNTPLIVQMFFVFFGLPFLGVRLSPFEAAWIAIAAQHTASFSEIYRAGLGAVSQRHREAAKVIGLGYWKALRLVVLPLAIVQVLPALANETVQIIKDTSVASTIALVELTLRARAIEEATAATSVVFIAVACYYLFLTGIVTLGARVVEERLRFAE